MDNQIISLLEKAFLAQKNKKYDIAESLYRSVLKLDPDQPIANNNLGIISRDMGRIENSIIHFNKAINKDNKNNLYITNLIQSFIYLNRLDIASNLLDEKLSGKINTEARKKLKSIINNKKLSSDGTLLEPVKKKIDKLLDLYKKNLFKEAFFFGQDLLMAHPKNPLILNIMGAVNDKLLNFKTSVQYFKLAYNYDQNNASILNNLSGIFIKLKKYDEALKYLKKSLSHNPYSDEAYYNIGNCYYMLNKYENSIRNLKKANSIKPNFSNYQLRLSHALYKAGRYHEAIDAVVLDLTKIKHNFN